VTPDRKRFDALLTSWRESADQIDLLKERQEALAEDINKTYGKVVTEEQLLANLPWTFSIGQKGSASIRCDVDDADAFLKTLEWDDHRRFYHHRITLGEHMLLLDDGVLTIYLSGLDAMIDFCKEQGIKPDITAINVQRDEARKQVEHFSNIIDKLEK